MTTRSVISSEELSRQIFQGFVNQSFEVTLVNAPGTVYQPSVTTNASFLQNELTPGTFDYMPAVFTYIPADETNYSDGGIGLETKTAVFNNNGQGSYQFTHVVLKRGNGNVQAINSPSQFPTAGSNGTAVGLPTVNGVDGDGNQYPGDGLTIDVTVINQGVTGSDWQLTINQPGYGYEEDGQIIITADVLLDAGLTIAQSSGDLVFTINQVSSSDGAIVSVTPTENTVIMSDGNEAVFYFNIKQFGFASQL